MADKQKTVMEEFLEDAAGFDDELESDELNDARTEEPGEADSSEIAADESNKANLEELEAVTGSADPTGPEPTPVQTEALDPAAGQEAPQTPATEPAAATEPAQPVVAAPAEPVSPAAAAPAPGTGNAPVPAQSHGSNRPASPQQCMARGARARLRGPEGFAIGGHRQPEKGLTAHAAIVLCRPRRLRRRGLRIPS